MTVIYSIAAAFFCVFFSLFALKRLHIAQLDGYAFLPVKKTDETYKKTILFLALMILGTLFSLFAAITNIVFLNALCLIIDFALLSLFLYFYKEKHKVKLKLTKRAVRLLLVQFLFGAALISSFTAICLIFNGTYLLLTLLPCCLFFSQPTLRLANAVLCPLERAIKQRYKRKAAKIIASKKSLIKIGITGSYGKTSVKNILAHLLSAKYNVLMTPESYNTPMGICKTVADLKGEHEVFLCEMGARHVGDIKELCDMVHPQYGIVTGINRQHIETFVCIENTVKTKFELIDSLPENGFAVISGDNDLCRAAADSVKVDYRLVGLKSLNDLKAENISVSESGSRFDLVGLDLRIPCKTTLLGRHNIANIALASAMALKLGVGASDLSRAIASLSAPAHRLQLIRSGGLVIIDDTFNANETGIAGALDALSLFGGRRKIIVTPGLVEMGANEYDANFEVGKQIAAVCDLAIVIGNERSKPIVNGLLSQNYPRSNIIVKNSLEEAKAEFGKILKAGDVVLLENDLPDNYNE